MVEDNNFSYACDLEWYCQRPRTNADVCKQCKLLKSKLKNVNGRKQGN